MASRSLALGVVMLAALACGGEPAPRPEPTVPPPAAAAVAGAVVKGFAAPAAGGFPAVVMLDPVPGKGPGEEAPGSAGAGDAAARDGSRVEAPAPVYMDQIGSAFYPPTLLVRAGGPVDFLNSEGVMHNVNVTGVESGTTAFNIATPPGFESYRHVFPSPGVYRVTCDIHASMSAFIVVVSTPWAVVAEPDGSFLLSDVPAGWYRASVWSRDPSRRVRRDIEVPSGGGTVELDLRSPAAAE